MYVIKWIEHSPERPLGRVKQLFARFEFQSGKGCGNLPHIHMGVVLEDEEMEYTQWRVSCDEQKMFYCAGRGKEGEKFFFFCVCAKVRITTFFYFFVLLVSWASLPLTEGRYCNP